MMTLTYAANPLDRAHLIRRDGRAIAAAWADRHRRVVPVWRNRHAVDAALTPLFIEPPESDQGGPSFAAAVFLGLVDGAPWFAVDLSDAHDPPPLIGPPPAAWEDLRAIGPALDSSMAAILATARGLLAWHRRHRFCGACGHETTPEDGGHVRGCTNPGCGLRHFPRLDPAVIMLVTDTDDRALLGHAPRMPPGMMTTLAGFVEHGETLEQAVAREVAEETGVRVAPASVAYVASQPWPFPGSIMLAFAARADTTTIEVDPAELDHAGWYTRAEVAAFREVTDPGTGPALPRHDSVARALIDRWLSSS